MVILSDHLILDNFYHNGENWKALHLQSDIFIFSCDFIIHWHRGVTVSPILGAGVQAPLGEFRKGPQQ